MPKIYIINADYMNAFASGYSERSAMVAITKGLLEKLDRDELTAVMAHELGLDEGMMNIPMGTSPSVHIQIQADRSRWGRAKKRPKPTAKNTPRLTNRTVRAVA